MTPVPFYVFPRRDIERIAPIPRDFLATWEAARPGVLDDESVDVFLPNSRTEKQGDNTLYSLWQRVNLWHVTPNTPIVVMSWLEILMNSGERQGISMLMNAVCERFPNNPKIWSWNHDADQATIPELQNLNKNEFCLSYNTSQPSPQDILVPFWNCETRLSWCAEDNRPTIGGFMGHVGGLLLRQKMVAAFGYRGWQCSPIRRPQEDYLKAMLTWDFALCPRGGGLSSYRFYESLQCGCIPILFADDAALPYQDIDWSLISVRLPESMAGNFDACMAMLERVDVKEMRKWIAAVRHRFSLAGVQREIHKRLMEYLS